LGLGQLINNNTTALINNTSVQTASSISDMSSGLTSKLSNTLIDSRKELSSLASFLSILKSAAKLNAAMSSLASVGEAIQLPAVATNTNDRTSVTSQISTIINNSKISASMIRLILVKL